MKYELWNLKYETSTMKYERLDMIYEMKTMNSDTLITFSSQSTCSWCPKKPRNCQQKYPSKAHGVKHNTK